MMLQTIEIGGGRVEYQPERGRARLTLPPKAEAFGGRPYADAQLDDYHGLPRWRWPSRPPMRVSLRARASHPNPAGTLGFGFWNDPFTLSGGVLAAPNTVWFFYASPPSDMALAEGVPGRGWKAATLYAGRYPTLLIAPAALAAIALTRIPGLGQPIMSAARRMVQAREAMLDDAPLSEWHTYELEWREKLALFYVDGMERLRSPAPPRGPLGFVLWMDNQYAIASRDGKFGFGLCEVTQEQWLEVENLRLTPADEASGRPR
jgi:hypothetical protein